MTRRLEGRPWRTLRAAVLTRDTTCHICNQPIDKTLSGLEPMGPVVDHLVPIAKGGTNELRNLAAAHRACNAKKGDRPSWACDYPDPRGRCSHPSHGPLYWHDPR